MPDSFGKRQRDQVKARKAAARDERRIARTKRRRQGSPAEHGADGIAPTTDSLEWTNQAPPIQE